MEHASLEKNKCSPLRESLSCWQAWDSYVRCRTYSPVSLWGGKALRDRRSPVTTTIKCCAVAWQARRATRTEYGSRRDNGAMHVADEAQDTY